MPHSTKESFGIGVDLGCATYSHPASGNSTGAGSPYRVAYKIFFWRGEISWMILRTCVYMRRCHVYAYTSK